jgi:hypothetical protein
VNSAGRYWVEDWIHEVDINTERDLQRALNDGRGFRRALDICESALEGPHTRRHPIDAQGTTTVAGRPLDLSGIRTCSSLDCLRRELDEGLANLWQFLGNVVVEGFAPGRFLSPRDPDIAKQRFFTHAAMYLHARRIGALPHMVFRTKPALCKDHFKQHAKEIGRVGALDSRLARSTIKRLATEGVLEIRQMPNGDVEFAFTHPLQEGWTHITYSADYLKTKSVTLETIATRVFREACVATIGDVALAQQLSCPLGTDIQKTMPYGHMEHGQATVDDVALALHTPCLVGMTSEQTLRLRADHRAEYEQFLAATTLAIGERLERKDSDDPRKAPEMSRESLSSRRWPTLSADSGHLGEHSRPRPLVSGQSAPSW